MNILVPDKWLRKYLKTDATPKQLKEYLSLCGPSVERINTTDHETVYDIEVTGNRPDAMSVVGIAREAAAILPQFHIAATLQEDPYSKQKGEPMKRMKSSTKLPLRVTTDALLNPRWMTVVFDGVRIAKSPTWMIQDLQRAGIRPLNTIIDITNYLMIAYGQPAHAFDYDCIGKHTMHLRESQKGETITTLDGKVHTLPGKDIVIEDGNGILMDLCGIMGGQSSAITNETKRVVLFVQTYDPSHIRKTSMSLAHRTAAAGLFEKGTDTELVEPVFVKGVKLIQKLTGASVASEVIDIYPHPFSPFEVFVSREKVDAYIGTHLDEKKIIDLLTTLGFQTSIQNDDIRVLVPSYRRDVSIDVDIIEEIARLYGYHKIIGKLPETEPPVVFEDPMLDAEARIKTTLRNWGYTELYTYSMITEDAMRIYHFDTTKSYHITNPLSQDWVYMRPSLLPSMLAAIKQNTAYEPDLKLFELSMTYGYKTGDLPDEEPTLIIAVTGKRFLKLKGIAESIFASFGIEMPNDPIPAGYPYDQNISMRIATFGRMGEIDRSHLLAIGVAKPITVLELSVRQLVKNQHLQRTYIPIPKYPPSYEDIAFVIPEKTPVAEIMATLKKIDPLVVDVSLFDSFNDVRTFHITYQSPQKNLTADDVAPVRNAIIKRMTKIYRATLKTA